MKDRAQGVETGMGSAGGLRGVGVEQDTNERHRVQPPSQPPSRATSTTKGRKGERAKRRKDEARKGMFQRRFSEIPLLHQSPPSPPSPPYIFTPLLPASRVRNQLHGMACGGGPGGGSSPPASMSSHRHSLYGSQNNWSCAGAQEPPDFSIGGVL
jgi:hypothetical protein